MTLMNADTSSVRLQIPAYVGERYGTPIPALESASHGTSSRTRIRISTEIQTSGRIKSITSPSHPDIVETRYSTHLGRASRRRSTVKFRSKTFLETDFVLVVKADGLDAPRCFAEIDRDPNGNGDTLAMQLSIVPKFNLPPVPSQEYLFLVDRSGSMSGARIETAKSTLALLLRMLPNEGTIFNIFSFGSHVDGLWGTSSKYDEAALAAAVSSTLASCCRSQS